MGIENLNVADNLKVGAEPSAIPVAPKLQEQVNYQVFNVTDPKNVYPVTYSMSLIEAEVTVQKTLADPFHGVIIQPEQDGTVHGTLNGVDISLRPLPEDTTAEVKPLAK